MALCLAAVFPVTAAGSLVAGHGCPHHDGPAAGVSHGMAASTGAGEAARYAGAAAPYADHGGAEPRDHHGGAEPRGHHDGVRSPTHHDDTTSYCTCVGDCHAGAAVPHLAAATLRLASDARSADEPATAREYHPRAVAYLLPFANGPPAA